MMGLIDLKPIHSLKEAAPEDGQPTQTTAPEQNDAPAPSNDHEVSMARNSLDAITKHAAELLDKIGQEEKDIPAWIQDHITNAANFLSQAANNYHENNHPDHYSDSPEPEGEPQVGMGTS